MREGRADVSTAAGRCLLCRGDAGSEQKIAEGMLGRVA